MSSASPPDEVPAIGLDSNGRLHVEAACLPDLPQVLERARRLVGLAVTATAHQPGTRRVSGHWTLGFSYRGRRFVIHTNYHAGLTVYSASDPDCPESLLREVVDHFEGSWPSGAAGVPPPPLGGRRLGLLFLLALAVAVPLTVFLVLFRKP